MVVSNMLRCPECNSRDVFVCHVQAFDARTGEHVVHLYKTHDKGTIAGCRAPNCDWRGLRYMLDGEEDD